MMAKNNLCAIINLTENDDALRPLTNNRPIAALPFVSRYRLIDFMLSDITYAGIESVGLFIGDSGRSIYDHVRSGDSWDLDSSVRGGVFTFSQRNWKRAHRDDDDIEDYYYDHRIFMKRSRADYVFIAGSKILANVDIKAIHQQHLASDKDITCVYKHVKQSSVGGDDPKEFAIIFDNNYKVNRIVQYTEVANDETVNAALGMYILSVDKMNEIINRALKDDIYLELDELIRHYLMDYSINTYEYTGYVTNVDSIEQYYKANMEMLDRKNFTALFQSSIPIRTKSKNGAPTYYAVESDVTSSIVATDVFLAGKVRRSLINRRAVIEKDAVVKESIILQGTKIGEGAQVEYAIIDKNCVVEPGAKVIGTKDNLVVIGKNTVIKAED